jgi:hypothetical protein
VNRISKCLFTADSLIDRTNSTDQGPSRKVNIHSDGAEIRSQVQPEPLLPFPQESAARSYIGKVY